MGNEEIFVCCGRWCHELGSDRVLARLKKRFHTMLGKNERDISSCRCTGHCEQGVNLVVGESVIHEVTEDNVFDKLEDEDSYRPLHQEVSDEVIEDYFLDDF